MLGNKALFTIFSVLLSASLINGCSTESHSSDYYRSSTDSNLVVSPTAVVYSPCNVIIFNSNNAPNESKEHVQYINIDIYNEYGIRRQQAQINQILKEEAYSLGGNAIVIIDNPNDKKHCYAEVIQMKYPSSTSTTAISSAKTTQTPKKIATPTPTAPPQN